jgi:hypothetical protein
MNQSINQSIKLRSAVSGAARGPGSSLIEEPCSRELKAPRRRKLLGEKSSEEKASRSEVLPREELRGERNARDRGASESVFWETSFSCEILIQLVTAFCFKPLSRSMQGLLPSILKRS